jgi:DNA-binding winged helix-turn-helix (wHTH) protein
LAEGKSWETAVKTRGIRGVRETIGFDGFVLDPARRQLSRGGNVLHLTPKAFDLLEFLVSQAQRVVPKKELHEQLWPDSFVSDATLVGVIKELRRVLDDRLPDRPIIRTAHRVGYAFCRPVAFSSQSGSHLAHWVVVDDLRIALKAGENIIGRDPASEVWLDLVAVSRRHARIVVEGQDAMLEDLGSRNGTKLGDCLVAGESPLRDGDVIKIGSASLVYRNSSAGATTQST